MIPVFPCTAVIVMFKCTFNNCCATDKLTLQQLRTYGACTSYSRYTLYLHAHAFDVRSGVTVKLFRHCRNINITIELFVLQEHVQQRDPCFRCNKLSSGDQRLTFSQFIDRLYWFCQSTKTTRALQKQNKRQPGHKTRL